MPFFMTLPLLTDFSCLCEFETEIGALVHCNVQSIKGDFNCSMAVYGLL